MDKALHQQTTFNYTPNDQGIYTITRGDTLIFRGCLPIQHHYSLEKFILLINWFDLSIYCYAFKEEYIKTRFEHLNKAIGLWIDNMNTDTPAQIRFDRCESFKRMIAENYYHIKYRTRDEHDFSFVKALR